MSEKDNDRIVPRPEFDLPGLLIKTVREYLGPTIQKKMAAAHAGEIMSICVQTAREIGEIVEQYKPPPRVRSKKKPVDTTETASTSGKND